MTRTSAIPLAGADLHADLSGALFWQDESTMVVADLHLEKGSSYAARARAQFLPPYDTRSTLDRLDSVLSLYTPRRVIFLGDSVHDSGASDRIDAGDANRISAMTAKTDWIWIAGNHDPEPPSCWGGNVLRVTAASSSATIPSITQWRSRYPEIS